MSSYSEKLIRIFLLLCLADDILNGFGGDRRTRIDTVCVLELALNTGAAQPLVLGNIPPAQDGEDGGSAKNDAGLWVPQDQPN